ncbi:TetR family transcriptional regulator [Pseudoclavibacter sp. 13-3]|uniref:TetR family transcriptional regulator n=1 Tax=Pseudoclavibacter sp. 13-3 TaxID=2901228 RepID=UPI003FA7E50C
MLTARGFAETSLNDIGHAARVTCGAVHHHYQNKPRGFSLPSPHSCRNPPQRPS